MYLLLFGLAYENPEIKATEIPIDVMIDFFEWIERHKNHIIDVVEGEDGP